MNERDKKNDDEKLITSTELKYILETNQKAIGIHLEVEQQNEQVLNNIDDLKIDAKIIKEDIDDVKNDAKIIKEDIDDIKSDISLMKIDIADTLKSTLEIEDLVKTIEKNTWRLIIILTSAGAGIIYTIIQSIVHH